MGNVFFTVCRVSLLTSVVIVALSLVSLSLQKKYLAKWKYWLWFLVAVRLVIPFQFVMPKAHLSGSTGRSVLGVGDAMIQPAANAIQYAQRQPMSIVSPQGFPINLCSVLAIVWLAGAVLFFLWRLIGFQLAKRRLLRWCIPHPNRAVVTAAQAVAKTMGIKRYIPVWTGTDIHSPMMMGFFRPLLLLPDIEYDDQDRTLLLRHEFEHLRRGDLWYKLLLNLAVAVHWFNPVVHLMYRLANMDLELSCDENVLQKEDSGSRRAYGELLISSSSRNGDRCEMLTTAFFSSFSAMKKRIEHIMYLRGKRGGKVLLAGFLGMLLVVSSVTAYAEQHKRFTVGDQDGFLIQELFSDDSLAATAILQQNNDFYVYNMLWEKDHVDYVFANMEGFIGLYDITVLSDTTVTISGKIDVRGDSRFVAVTDGRLTYLEVQDNSFSLYCPAGTTRLAFLSNGGSGEIQLETPNFPNVEVEYLAVIPEQVTGVAQEAQGIQGVPEGARLLTSYEGQYTVAGALELDLPVASGTGRFYVVVDYTDGSVADLRIHSKSPPQANYLQTGEIAQSEVYVSQVVTLTSEYEIVVEFAKMQYIKARIDIYFA